MNTHAVNAAAGVILAAIAQGRVPVGIALALESAGLLMSPETAAELERLRARVAELEQDGPREHTVDEDPIAFALTDQADDVTPQVQALRALLAGQRQAGDLS
ncbi:hypothetical protein [Streptomyces sp. NPDC004685]